MKSGSVTLFGLVVCGHCAGRRLWPLPLFAASFIILTSVSSTSSAFRLGRMEHRQQNGWLQSSQNGLTALLVDGNPAGQCGGNAHVLVENFLRLLGLTDLEDQTFAGELHALLRHGLFEVVNLHDAKMIGLNGGVQGSRSLTHGLVGG